MRSLWLCALLSGLATPLLADEFNYDESKVPTFTLPDPLVQPDGTRVTSAEQWQRVQRPRLLKQVAEDHCVH